MTSKRQVLLSLSLLTELFDHLSPQTIYRWNIESGGRPKMLPEPDQWVGRTPLWDEETILVWAQERKLKVNESALRGIRRTQRSGVPSLV